MAGCNLQPVILFSLHKLSIIPDTMIPLETPKNQHEKHQNPLDMSSEEFREAGYQLVDKIAQFLAELPQKCVTTAEKPQDIRRHLGEGNLPDEGASASLLLEESSRLLFEHSLFNGHPRFWGYITSSATPIGALGDLLASAVNANAGAYPLSPMATEIERQTIRWIAELIHYPVDCGGIFVSGGNMANFTGFLAARKQHGHVNIREVGLREHPQMVLYCAQGTHTWIQKAADLFGLGTDAIRWIEVNAQQQMDVGKLTLQIEKDKQHGKHPFMVVGTAGSVSTGAVDDLSAIAEICRQHNIWFHVDGAYGAPASALPENSGIFKGLSEADSIALDPHKWLYSPLEAGCVLVRNPEHLTAAFSFHPEYYNFDGTDTDPQVNFHDYGLQNSRGFRALKVWLGLKQAGKKGYIHLIREDIALAKVLHELLSQETELEAFTQHLSITTFRYCPSYLQLAETEQEQYLSQLNEALLNRLQSGGEVFLSNAVLEGKYCLRVCVVNFRTSFQDMKALVGIVLREGKALDAEMRAHFHS